jgi:hypothetical protein
LRLTRNIVVWTNETETGSWLGLKSNVGDKKDAILT